MLLLVTEQLLHSLPPLLPEQEEIQPPVPTVLGSIDYRTWRQRLERIDEIPRQSRAEEAFVRLCLKRRLAEAEKKAQAEERPVAALCGGDQVLFHYQEYVVPTQVTLLLKQTVVRQHHQAPPAPHRQLDQRIDRWRFPRCSA